MLIFHSYVSHFPHEAPHLPASVQPWARRWPDIPQAAARRAPRGRRHSLEGKERADLQIWWEPDIIKIYHIHIWYMCDIQIWFE